MLTSLQIANDVDIPRGIRLLCTRPVEVGLVIEFRGPYSDGERITIDMGQDFEVIVDSPVYATGIACSPYEKALFEQRYVPERYQRGETYAGFHLVIPKEEIGGSIEVLRQDSDERCLAANSRMPSV